MLALASSVTQKDFHSLGLDTLKFRTNVNSNQTASNIPSHLTLVHHYSLNITLRIMINIKLNKYILRKT